MLRLARTPRFLISLVFVTLSASSTLAAQKKAAPPAADPQIEAMDKLYRELVEVVRGNRVDPRRDDLRAIHEKREALRLALYDFAEEAKKLMFDRRHLGLDYVRFVETTFPRLSGNVVKVGPDHNFKDLQAAMSEIEPGDVVLLGEGKFQLPRVGGEWRDIAFVGRGSDKTTLACRLDKARRVRLVGLKIDCNNDPFLYLRTGGAVQVQKCLVTNYNSGAGGSNAVAGMGASLLIEDCEFEGLSGRRAKRGSGGTAFDLRGSNFLYVRNSEFVDNSEIVRATSLCVFDRCRSRSRSRSASGISMYPAGYVLARRNRCLVRGKISSRFEVATDDREVVTYLMDPKAELAEDMKVAVETLGLRDNPRHWATLLHHPDEEVQFVAQGRLSALLRGALPKHKIDKKVLAQVPEDMRKPFAAALRSSRALSWLEDNEARLVWKEKRKAFELRK